MEENIKNRIILILSVITAIFFIGTIGSCASAGRMKSARDKEMAGRLDFEEKTTKCAQERNALQERLKVATQALETEKTEHQATKKDLLQEQLVNDSLKDELLKLTKVKEKLEESLNAASNKSKTKK